MSKKPAPKKKPTPKEKPAAAPRTRKAKAKKVSNARFVCKDCNANDKGGYFTAPNEKGVKCPHCSSTSVKLLG